MRRAWLLWVTLGEFLGFAFPATVGALSVGWAPVPAAAALLAAGAVEGGLLGAAQAHVLRRVLPALPRGRFIAATAAAAVAAYAIGLVPSTVGERLATVPMALLVALAVVGGAVLLSTIGTAQWWVVRHVARRSAAWIPATAAAWAVGLLAFMGVATPLWQSGQPVLLVIAIGALGGLVMAFVVAVITGVALLRIFAPKQAVDGGDDDAPLPSRFPPDHGLTARMAGTVVLLGLVYAAFVAVLIVLIKSVAIVVLVAGGVLLAQYWFSDRIALYAMRATVVDRDAQPRLHAIVDRLCAAANMDKPQIALAHTDLPNAFATGRSSKRAVLCVTDELLRRLDTDELDGVLAHELSHIAHRDVAVMTLASFAGVLAGLVMRFGFYSSLFGGRGRRDNLGMVVLAVVAVSGAVYVLSFLLTRALSRYRELAADRSGAMLTGQPSALASALIKVTDATAHIPSRDLRTVQPLNALLFAPATGAGALLATLLSTHPPLQQRLDQLAALAARM